MAIGGRFPGRRSITLKPKHGALPGASGGSRLESRRACRLWQDCHIHIKQCRALHLCPPYDVSYLNCEIIRSHVTRMWFVGREEATCFMPGFPKSPMRWGTYHAISHNIRTRSVVQRANLVNSRATRPVRTAFRETKIANAPSRHCTRGPGPENGR